MPLLDIWNNPLGSTAVQAIGYRDTADDFPHDLYSFLLSSIRDADQANVGLLYRWLQPMNLIWQQQYSAIYNLYNLLSPEDCPTEYLDLLAHNVGIQDDLSYIWGYLSEMEKRRFIKYFIRFLEFRGTFFGTKEIVETMSGQPALLQGYFFYRWLISGDEELYMETAIGRENEPGDPWLISEHDVPIGQLPDSVSLLTDPATSLQYYQFTVNTLVSLVTNPPIPIAVYVRCRITGKTFIAQLRIDGSDYVIRCDNDYFFEQVPSSYSTLASNFQVGFEIDQYVSDILIVDDGTLNRDMMRGLVRFSRPMSERVYVRYYLLIDDFRNDLNWEDTAGTVVYDEDEQTVLLADPAIITVYELTASGSSTWEDYAIVVKAQFGVAEKYSIIRFMYQDANNYYFVRILPKAPPTVPACEVYLYNVVAGVPTLITSGTTDYADVDVDYCWRIESFTSARPGGDVQVIRIYQDEVMIIDAVDDPLLFASATGTIHLVCENGGELLVKEVLVHPIPLESDYIGPTV